jgi:HlyD family secretion protein
MRSTPLAAEGREAGLANTKVRLQKISWISGRRGAVESDFHQAELQEQTNEGLSERLIADLTLKLSRVKSEELATRNGIEKKRLAFTPRPLRRSWPPRRRASNSSALAQLKQSQLEALKVRAGIHGVLQELPLQPEPTRDRRHDARESRSAGQTQASSRSRNPGRDVQIREIASIDTHAGIVSDAFRESSIGQEAPSR